MKQIINRKKYDTDNAYLLAIHKNHFLKQYEEELQEWHKLNDPVDEPDFDFDDDLDDPDSGDQDAEEENNNGTDLTEPEEEDDFVFLSNSKLGADSKIVTLSDVDFDFDLDEDLDDPKDPSDKEDEGGGSIIIPDEDEPDIVIPDDAEDNPEPRPQEVVPDYKWPDPVEGIRVSPQWKIERLYMKKSTGEYFLLVEGGYMTEYHRPKIEPFLNDSRLLLGELPYYDEGLALDWAVARLSVEQVEKIFGEIEE